MVLSDDLFKRRLLQILGGIITSAVLFTSSFAASFKTQSVTLGSSYACELNLTLRKSALLKISGKKKIKTSFSKGISDLKRKRARARTAKLKSSYAASLKKLTKCQNGTFLRAALPATPTPMPTSTPTATPTPNNCPNYRLLWNLNSPTADTQIDTSASEKIEQDRIVFVNPGWAGLWPSISGPAGNRVMNNGGIPQLADISAHVAHMKDFLIHWINTDSNFNGYVVIDWEEWTQWDSLANDSGSATSKYKEASINYVLSLNPSLSGQALQDAAKASWDAAALNFLIQTQRAAKELYPNSKVGFYALMPRRYWTQYYGSSGAAYKAINNFWLPLFQESDVIIPSIYQFYKSSGNGSPVSSTSPQFYWPAGIWQYRPSDTSAWYDENRRYVKDNITEARRLADLAGGKEVIAYTWPRYHNSGVSSERLTLVNEADLYVQLFYPIKLGADGVVIWGSEEPAFGSNNGNMQDYVNSTMIPMVQNFCGARASSYQQLFDRLDAAEAKDAELGISF